jgi:hypothetical protein
MTEVERAIEGAWNSLPELIPAEPKEVFALGFRAGLRAAVSKKQRPKRKRADRMTFSPEPTKPALGD